MQLSMKTVSPRRILLGGRRAFTLLETMVCIGVLLVLALVLAPVVTSFTQEAHTTVCVGNSRQILGAVLACAAERGGRLPDFGEYNLDTGWAGNFWDDAIAPYLARPKGVVGTAFLRCPAEKDKKMNGGTIGPNYTDYRGGEQQNPGVRTDRVFLYKGFSNEGRNTQYHPGSARVEDIRPNTIVIADCRAEHGSRGGFYGPWTAPFNADLSGNGVKDSNTGRTSLPFNAWAPRHKGKAVCGFITGSIRMISIEQWETNEDQIWGP